MRTITPPVTRDELLHAGRIILLEKGRRGVRTNRQVAASIGISEADFSRLLNGNAKRIGLARLERVAAWVGTSVDGLLGREEGETKTVAEPAPVTRRADVVALAEALADQKIRFTRTVEAVVRSTVPNLPAEAMAVLLDDLARLADSHARRLAELFDTAKFARAPRDLGLWEVPELRSIRRR